MDKNRIEGAADKAKGDMKKAAGEITGDSKLKAKGEMDKAKGSMKKALGSAKDAMREARR